MYLKPSSHYRWKQGFTLIELIVTIFITSILIAVFSMLTDFSFKTLSQSYTANDNIDSSVHILGLISEEVINSEFVYSDNDFLLNKAYSNGLGFVLRIKDNENYTYVYYALKDANIWRIAINTKEKNPGEVPFDDLYKVGINSIVENVVSIEGTGFNTESKLISLSIELNNSTTEKYNTQLYANRVGEL